MQGKLKTYAVDVVLMLYAVKIKTYAADIVLLFYAAKVKTCTAAVCGES